MTGKLEHSKAQQTGPTHKLPAYPMIPPKKYENIQENARSQTNLLNMYTGGRRRRRKSRKKGAVADEEVGVVVSQFRLSTLFLKRF